MGGEQEKFYFKTRENYGYGGKKGQKLYACKSRWHT